MIAAHKLKCISEIVVDAAALILQYNNNGPRLSKPSDTFRPPLAQTNMLTAFFFPSHTFAIAFAINLVAVAWRSLVAVPFGTILAVLLLWTCVSTPLCTVGTLLGRKFSGTADNPCRVKRIPSAIPRKRWYQRPLAVALAGGLLPFGSIFIEMYFVFSSFWNYKIYYVYELMLLVAVMLILCTVCVTIVGVYFLLNAENYHWQWSSFAIGSSVSLYVFVYAVHYFFLKTKMTGMLQTIYYFGYTIIMCLGLGLICGSIGYAAAAAFVRRIYHNVKCD